jgi:hypothetical protein
MNPKFWQQIQTIDRRWIYAILIAVILIPLFDRKFNLPIIPSKQSQDFYDTIAQVPSGGMVLIDGQWSPGTRGENQWQTQAVLLHVMKRHLRFAILSFDPQNNTLVQDMVNVLAPKYGYVEGRDYVNFGYRPPSVFSQTVQAMATDIPGALKKDRHGNPLAGMPAMKGISSIQSMGAVVEVTPAATAETWLGLGGLRQGPRPVPFLLATTAVSAPTYYPYLDSGQIAGMLTGVKGAGDYEFLLGTSTFGTRATSALSLVYALIIGLIALGNIGYFAGRAAERRASQ